jgi:glyoxylase-like metal-dependent hydrolase (beta-lactamase superfamily II)
MVNSYLVEDGGDVTIVDAGAPAYWGQLPAELAAIGRSLDDVRSVVLTHGHSDHIGFAERIRSERGTPIRVHELDAALARGEVPNPAKGLGPTRVRPLLEFMLFSLRNGMMRIPRISEVATFGDGATLDVPGSPRVILVPGHTPGSAALLFAGHDALHVGDAMATHSVTTGPTTARGSRRSRPIPFRPWSRSIGCSTSRPGSFCPDMASPGAVASPPRSPPSERPR